jgi:GT2 family glycosyltransferase
VIPVYRPDGTALATLVQALTSTGIPTVVADDASPCTVDPLLASLSELGVPVVRHLRNRGIARSLNDGLRHAASVGAAWLLTVDQDSELSSGHVERLLDAAGHAAAMLGPDRIGAVAAGGIADASGALGYPVIDDRGVATTHEVIQTGTIWSVDALTALGGFDESLGIDAVDAAACLGLRAAGLSIVLAPGLAVRHHLGEGRQVRLLGRDVLASGHSPERRTTIVRNRLRLFPGEFAQSPTHALRTMRRVAMNTALAVTVEDDRWSKAKASARGLLPGKNG